LLNGCLKSFKNCILVVISVKVMLKKHRYIMNCQFKLISIIFNTSKSEVLLNSLDMSSSETYRQIIVLEAKG
jgi:hypothetical protein